MLGGKTAFQTTWLEHNDCSKTEISSWCRKGSDQFHVYCTVCYKEISCDNSGLEQLLQHARGTKHQTRVGEGGARRTREARRTLMILALSVVTPGD